MRINKPVQLRAFIRDEQLVIEVETQYGHDETIVDLRAIELVLAGLRAPKKRTRRKSC